MASCIRNIRTKNYQNLVIGFQVTFKNVGDAFLGGHSVVYYYNDYCNIVCRDTGIQALRLCLLSSSVRPSDRLLQDVEQLMALYISNSEDASRTVAAACLGTLCRCMDDEPQLNTLVNSVILGI